MKKSLIWILGMGCVVVSSLAFTSYEPRYKNLKVLPKDITEHQMDSVMHHFSRSLGVRCNFCHVRIDSTDKWDFASDDIKHKLAAREMIRMMNKINEQYFDVTGKITIDSKLLVTCFTCHRGSTDVVTMPPPMQRPQQAPANGQERSGTDSTRRNQDSTRRNQ